MYETMVHDVREGLRLARNDQRLPQTLRGLHVLACAMLMAQRFVRLVALTL
ncbi:MAG: hypothetical protein ACUVSF_09940 [Anaerolineae bacterium]